MLYIGYLISKLSIITRVLIKVTLYLFIRWMIALFLSTTFHLIIHFYIFPTEEAFSIPIYFTYDPCNPRKCNDMKIDRCSFLHAYVNLGGTDKLSMLSKGVQYSFEIMLELPEKLNENLGMLIICLELLDQQGDKDFNPWGDISPPNGNQYTTTDQLTKVNSDCTLITSANPNEWCKSTMLLNSKNSKLSQEDYLNVLTDPLEIFRSKLSKQSTFPIVGVNMKGKIPHDASYDVGWARVVVKNLNLHIYSARLNVTAEIPRYQYLLSLCPAIVGLTWLLMNTLGIFLFLCVINFPAIVRASERSFVNDLLGLSVQQLNNG